MRILVIMHLFLPDRHGSAAAHSELWMSLARKGVNVTVFCPHPFDRDVRSAQNIKGWKVYLDNHESVRLKRFPVWFHRSSASLVQRLRFEMSYFLSLMRSMGAGREYDLFFVYSPYVSGVAFAGLLKFLNRKPLWLHVLDVSSDAAHVAKIVQSSLLFRVLAAIERRIFNYADVWSTISPHMVQFLSGIRRKGQPIFLQSNWVERPLLKAIIAQSKLDSGGSKERVRLLYVGSLGSKQNLLGFCQALHTNSVDFKFRIFCHGSGAEPLRQWVASCGDPRFFYGSFLEDVGYARELGGTDFYVITERQGSGAAYFPGKILVALAAAVPTLAVCDAESSLGVEMEQHNLGPRFRWSELDDLIAFLGDTDRWRANMVKWQDNCSKRNKDFNQEGTVERFYQNFDRMAKRLPIELDFNHGDR